MAGIPTSYSLVAPNLRCAATMHRKRCGWGTSRFRKNGQSQFSGSAGKWSARIRYNGRIPGFPFSRCVRCGGTWREFTTGARRSCAMPEAVHLHGRPRAGRLPPEVVTPDACFTRNVGVVDAADIAEFGLQFLGRGGCRNRQDRDRDSGDQCGADSKFRTLRAGACSRRDRAVSIWKSARCSCHGYSDWPGTSRWASGRPTGRAPRRSHRDLRRYSRL